MARAKHVAAALLLVVFACCWWLSSQGFRVCDERLRHGARTEYIASVGFASCRSRRGRGGVVGRLGLEPFEFQHGGNITSWRLLRFVRVTAACGSELTDRSCMSSRRAWDRIIQTVQVVWCTHWPAHFGAAIFTERGSSLPYTLLCNQTTTTPGFLHSAYVRCHVVRLFSLYFASSFRSLSDSHKSISAVCVKQRKHQHYLHCSHVCLIYSLRPAF